jgi:signal recognition particle receptor subunit beta
MATGTDRFLKLQYGRVVPTQTSMRINSCVITHASLEKPVTIIDCPGHPRLAHLLRQSLSTSAPRGVIVMIDAATIKQELNSVANTVYSTLLVLPRPVHVLFVTNKSDLFTAFPVHKVRELLEEEISILKKTRDDGLEDDDERATLGGTDFKFGELEEDGVMVKWANGSIESREVAGILEWISERIS